MRKFRKKSRNNLKQYEKTILVIRMLKSLIFVLAILIIPVGIVGIFYLTGRGFDQAMPAGNTIMAMSEIFGGFLPIVSVLTIIVAAAIIVAYFVTR